MSLPNQSRGTIEKNIGFHLKAILFAAEPLSKSLQHLFKRKLLKNHVGATSLV